jgi:hypothetical protein
MAIFAMMLRLYERGKVDKDILRRCATTVAPEMLCYITKEEYKLITGEDWTAPDN